MEPVVYHLYDSSNHLHADFNDQYHQMINDFKKNSGIQIISIDLKFLNHADADKYIKLVTGHSI